MDIRGFSALHPGQKSPRIHPAGLISPLLKYQWIFAAFSALRPGQKSPQIHPAGLISAYLQRARHKQKGFAVWKNSLSAAAHVSTELWI
jgi:hypothetical protein